MIIPDNIRRGIHADRALVIPDVDQKTTMHPVTVFPPQR
jgi:hypothetical protein